MRLPTFRFPHIPRLFTATIVFLVLWGGLGLLLTINTQSRKASPRPATSVQIKTSEAVLGATASESAKLTEQLAYWKSITEKKPDYRDAFIVAASLAYKLKNTDEAKRLINRAFALDPTSPAVLEIKKLLEE